MADVPAVPPGVLRAVHGRGIRTREEARELFWRGTALAKADLPIALVAGAAGAEAERMGDNHAPMPCPFCSRTDLLAVEPHPENGFAHVKCRACGCDGPAGRSMERSEAIACWNSRGVRSAGRDVADRVLATLACWSDEERAAALGVLLDPRPPDRGTRERITGELARWMSASDGKLELTTEEVRAAGLEIVERRAAEAGAAHGGQTQAGGCER